jgi:hypothetical protein
MSRLRRSNYPQIMQDQACINGILQGDFFIRFKKTRLFDSQEGMIWGHTTASEQSSCFIKRGSEPVKMGHLFFRLIARL